MLLLVYCWSTGCSEPPKGTTVSREVVLSVDAGLGKAMTAYICACCDDLPVLW